VLTARFSKFIELYNSQVFAEEISGYRLSGEIS